MTEAQYNSAYLKALQNGSNLTREIIRELKQTYIDAANFAATQVRNAELAGLSDLTFRSWRNIELSLREGALMITDRLDDLLKNGLLQSSETLTAIDEKYLVDIIRQNDLGLSIIKIENIFTGVNDTVLRATLNRIYSDGYTYSQRIWNVGLDYQKQIKQLITSDLAVGRDLVETAKDLKAYVQYDRQAVAKRWGDLLSGNKEWLRRIRGDIDYNALRLIRSELYASLQSSSILSASVNPGATGWYNWIRQTTEDWNCACPGNEAGSPYTAQTVPGYAHSNCLCIIQPILRNREEFMKDLTTWSNGGSVDYIDSWYYNYYQYAA